VTAVPAGVRADPPPRVGVVAAVTVNVTAEEAAEVASALAEALQEELVVDVIVGEEVSKRLPDGGLSDVCVVDPECVRDLGERLGADQLLVLAIVRVGTHLQIDPTVVDVASGRTASQAPVRLDADADAVTAFRAIAGRLVAGATKRSAIAETDTADEVAPPAVTPALVPNDRAGAEGGVSDVVTRGGRDRHMTTGAWVAGGVGAASLIAGVGFAAKARSGFQDLEDKGCDQVACDQGEIDRVSRDALLADVLVGVGLAAGVTAAILYLRSGTEAKEVRVSASPDGVMFAVGGRF
jgi:hypothetical protein